MEYEEFLDQIRDRSDLAARDHAEQVTRATLGQRLSGGETTDVAAQLPAELQQLLDGHPGDAESFDVDEFLRRVAERESRHCGPEEARVHARAVLSTVASSVSEHEFDAFRSQLPVGYEMLLR